MIGNDIVDLAKADCHPRFAQRVLCDAEWLRYQAISDPEQQRLFLWKSWAAKESAFKALRRLRPACQAIARHFVCDADFQQVLHAEQSFFIRFPHGCGQQAYIYAVATLKEDGRTQDEIVTHVEDWRDESLLAQSLAVRMMGERTGRTDWLVVKDAVSHAPTLVSKSAAEDCRVPFSITHHGRYCAVSLDIFSMLWLSRARCLFK